MTVSAMGGDNYTHAGLARVVKADCVLCQWFDRNTLVTDQIPLTSLTLLPDAEGEKKDDAKKDPKPLATSDRGPG